MQNKFFWVWPARVVEDKAVWYCWELYPLETKIQEDQCAYDLNDKHLYQQGFLDIAQPMNQNLINRGVVQLRIEWITIIANIPLSAYLFHTFNYFKAYGDMTLSQSHA